MEQLLKKMGITQTDVIASVQAKRGAKETTDSVLVKKIRNLMNNKFLEFTALVNNATYFEKKYQRDEKKRIVLDKDKNKVIEGHVQRTLTGQFIIEDNKDGTHTATRFNVYKDSYLIDSNTLSIANVTNGKQKEETKN
jgi:adenosyl cobinamide kinase/adenosyl cobinamide phosphate guanylyltransferase